MNEGRRYRVDHILGQGGFGTVYAAELLGEGGFTRKVALKILNADMAAVDDVANRLRDEARLLGLLRHRAIVQVDGLVMLDGKWTVVMELIEGADLQKIVRSAGPLPVGCALEVISEAASALDVAYHTTAPNGQPMRLIHRDIKPPNLIVTGAGETKVLDFGIARADFGGREAQTKSVLYGSIGYMAPERMEFEELPAGDVFALGAVLFEIIDGSPFGKASINPAKHAAYLEDALAKLKHKQPSLPPEFWDLLKSMLAYDPEERPTAREVERRCRAIRGQVGEPWLRDWAEKVIPPLAKKKADLKSDGQTGKVLIENTSRKVTENPPDDPAPAPKAPPKAPKTRELKPKDQGGGWGATLMVLGCGALMLATLAAVLVVVSGGALAGAAVVGAAVTSEDPGTVVVDPSLDPADPIVGTDPGLQVPPVDAPTDGAGLEDLFDLGALDVATVYDGMNADVVDPWKSYGLPVNAKGVHCFYCGPDTCSFTVKGRSHVAAGKLFAQAFSKAGWTRTTEISQDDTYAAIFEDKVHGGKGVAVSAVLIEGVPMVALSRY